MERNNWRTESIWLNRKILGRLRLDDIYWILLESTVIWVQGILQNQDECGGMYLLKEV